MSILKYIPNGRENRISRIEIRHYAGMDDVSVRKAIAKASLDVPVINTGDGYYIPDFNDPEEREQARKYAKMMKRRAYSELARARVIDGCIGVYDGGNAYKSARMLANLTQKEVAEATGLSVPEISKIENGKVMPTPEQHSAIERACGVEI